LYLTPLIFLTRYCPHRHRHPFLHDALPIYAKEPFVDVLPPGSQPETRWVRGTNQCRIAIHRPMDADTLVVLAVEDNLVKGAAGQDRKSTRLNSSHVAISYAVFCLKKKIKPT